MKNNIVRKGLVLGIILLFVGASVVQGISFNVSKELKIEKSRGTLYVGGSGPGNYTKIQDAIDNASSRDTVFVYSGTYYENVVVNKTIDLIGEDRDTTIIDGSGVGDVVYVSSDGITISCFTVQNGDYNGIELYSSSNNTIININASNNIDGIELYSSSNNTIMNNIVCYNKYGGIELYSSSNNTILNNNASNNWECIWLQSSSNNNIITGNIANSSNDTGICLYSFCNNNIITGNTVSNHYGAIFLYQSSNNTIIENYASNNGDGIYLGGSSNNLISGNTAHTNSQYGIRLAYSSYNNHLYHNTLIDNNQSAYDKCTNQWDNGLSIRWELLG